MGIPTDDEMCRFKRELTQAGREEASRKLNQGVYAPGDWKEKEVIAFLENAKIQNEDKARAEGLSLAKEANLISKKSNQIAICALIVSAVAFLVSVLAGIFK